ncbi:MAG: AAA family ATPase [Candidatus Eremiobacteraeota bacterium]|nr:AAA family ATPase [Candidatus Eremiobacteraeota bacterium]
MREVEASAADVAARTAERRVQGENARATAERLDMEAGAAREQCEKLEIAAGSRAHRFGELEKTLNALETQLVEVRGRVEDAETAVAQSGHDLAQTQMRHGEFLGEVRGTESRLQTIEELEAALEGHVPGTRAVVDAWQRGELSGIEGIVSNLITVEERYAQALDAAFGQRLSNIVTATSADAERAVKFLTRSEAGRATFLPLDRLGNRAAPQLSHDLRGVAGVIGYADTLVRAQARFAGIVAFLVGGTLVVDTLETALSVLRSRGFEGTIVTLGGEQVAGGGAITGGRQKHERSILSRRVLAEALREQLPDLRAKLADCETAVVAARSTSEKATAERDAARGGLLKLEVTLTEVRGEMASLSAEVERTRHEFDGARERLESLTAQAREARHAERRLSEPLDVAASEADRVRLEGQLATVRAEIAESEAHQTFVSHEGSELRERFAAHAAELDAARARLGMLDVDRERAHAARESMLSEISALQHRAGTAAARLEELRAEVTSADERLAAARKEREELTTAVTRLESDVRTAELEERETAAGGERHRTRLAEIEAELGMLVSQFAQNPATEQECADVEQRYAGEAGEFTVELPRLREELARLQLNVNLNAETDREEVAARERLLREQLEDLTRARETLLAVIREIEQTSQKQFNETFEQVAAAFSEMYAKLFPGGQASMWQTNPENLSETGIELSVQPPGKKMMALATLSGGERAMTSAALIFALIKVRPSPFYLLDEVDAALDDANVERFSNMVRELASDSQIILVTHNKKTMELADRMYGVTMAEPGVSSVISAALDREPEAAIA